VQQRITLKWGVWLCAGWACTQVVLTIFNLLLLTKAVELYSDEYGNQARVWVVFILNVGFGVVFAFSTYGLWRRQNWGRLLFLWAITIWTSFNLIGLFLPVFISTSNGQFTISQVAANGIRFALTLVIPLIYLNLPRVKALFYNNG